MYGTPDLDHGTAEVERLLGVRPAPGGQHPGWGTRNALIALGPASYLEIIGPDPAQPRPARGRPFGLDDLSSAKLVTWAAKGRDVESLRRAALGRGVRLGEVLAGRRQRADGSLLAWQMNDPWAVVADGIVPFFIDWGESPHPAATAPAGAVLVALRAEHRDAERVAADLQELGLDMAVTDGGAPRLIAVVEGPLGRIELA